MPNKEKTSSKDILFEEAVKGVKDDIRLTLILLAAFILLALSARFIFKVPLPFSVIIILFVWGLFYLSYNHFVKYKENKEDLCNFHFRNDIIDLLFLTAVIHYLGGVEWIGAIFYLCVLSWASSVLPKKKVFILCFLALFFYSALALLEYFKILPHQEAFGSSLGFYQDPVYIFIQILALTISFLFIIENYGTLSENLKKNQEKLVKAQSEIEEAKTVLEIKVKARTRELQELARKQEEIIKARTKEVQGKLEDMERFQKLAVGRELKMIELKKEMENLKKGIKSF